MWGDWSACTSPVSLSDGENTRLFLGRVIPGLGLIIGLSCFILDDYGTFLFRTVIDSCARPSVPGRLNHQF